MAHLDSPVTVVDQEESRPGASASTENIAPVSKRKSTDYSPPTQGPQVYVGWELVWGPPDTFSPDCLESPTPGAYTSEGSLSSGVVILQTGHGARGSLDA